ncbi:hypothetical protein D5039_05000 [Verminephrobacter aporrectodeae subsp. tuberculatae]|uniref:Uncharacterized protein n=1 Tax=Verminephrobacter aporrectodeae subsp. tuberculatae TaxID=1110392 RepID=A0ABT3KQG2_9BURK|nr:hypothetical protein [Verminephrobacter aporrectodeae]MCW5320562.1 hypothetical protein [Verminephrobacter aporrectodeae subsp. tuberculatae]
MRIRFERVPICCLLFAVMAQAGAAEQAKTQAGAVAQAKALAKETSDLMSLHSMMLVTAVRQRDTKGGKEDFQRFISGPQNKLQFRWGDLPRDVKIEYIDCIAALDEFINRSNDSFKAGIILPESRDLKENTASCRKRK